MHRQQNAQDLRFYTLTLTIFKTLKSVITSMNHHLKECKCQKREKSRFRHLGPNLQTLGGLIANFHEFEFLVLLRLYNKKQNKQVTLKQASPCK